MNAYKILILFALFATAVFFGSPAFGSTGPAGTGEPSAIQQYDQIARGGDDGGKGRGRGRGRGEHDFRDDDHHLFGDDHSGHHHLGDDDVFFDRDGDFLEDGDGFNRGRGRGHDDFGFDDHGGRG